MEYNKANAILFMVFDIYSMAPKNFAQKFGNKKLLLYQFYGNFGERGK